jgi:hypothetical protein
MTLKKNTKIFEFQRNLGIEPLFLGNGLFRIIITLFPFWKIEVFKTAISHRNFLISTQLQAQIQQIFNFQLFRRAIF